MIRRKEKPIKTLKQPKQQRDSVKELYKLPGLLPQVRCEAYGLKEVTGSNGKSNMEKELQTIVFNSFVFCQVFNEVNARKPQDMNVLDGLHKNRLFLNVMVFTCVVQALIVEFGGDFTSTVKLDWQMWILSICLGLISMPLAVLIKFIPVPDAPFITYLTPWRNAERQFIFRDGGTITDLLVGQKGADDIPFRRGSKFLEAYVAGETVRVPMPQYLPQYLPPPTEPFFERLKYAFFPNTHPMPSVTRSSTNPKANVAWP